MKLSPSDILRGETRTGRDDMANGKTRWALAGAIAGALVLAPSSALAGGGETSATQKIAAGTTQAGTSQQGSSGKSTEQQRTGQATEQQQVREQRTGQGERAGGNRQGRRGDARASAQGGGQGGTILDVEQLNDRIDTLIGNRVTVAGEIHKKLDAQSFVLESGGIFDDEITVIVPRDAKGISMRSFAEDSDVVVTGTVRTAPLVEIERELGWDLDPQYEIEFEGNRNFLVAEKITRQQR
jgi:hypothetical protein